jgi:hypothetical protein
VAYPTEREDKQLVVVDGVEGKEYDGIGPGSLVFSPEGKRVAYAALRGDKWLVVVDGVEGKKYDRIGGVLFCPDGRCVTYTVRRGGKWLIVVDGAEGNEYDGFLRGSRIVFDNPRSLHTLAVRRGEFFRVHIEWY